MRINSTWPTKTIKFNNGIVKKIFADDLRETSFIQFVENYKLIGIKLYNVDVGKKTIWYKFQPGSILPVFDFKNEDVKNMYKIAIPQIKEKLISIRPYIHYDLSPENILINNGVVRIIDPDSILIVDEDIWETEFYKSLRYLLLRCVELNVVENILQYFDNVINDELIKAKEFGDILEINKYYNKKANSIHLKKILNSRDDAIFNILTDTLDKDISIINLWNVNNDK